MRQDWKVSKDRVVVMRNGMGTEDAEQWRLFLHDVADRERTDRFRTGENCLAYAEVWLPYAADDRDLDYAARSFFIFAGDKEHPSRTSLEKS